MTDLLTLILRAKREERRLKREAEWQYEPAPDVKAYYEKKELFKEKYYDRTEELMKKHSERVTMWSGATVDQVNVVMRGKNGFFTAAGRLVLDEDDNILAWVSDIGDIRLSNDEKEIEKTFRSSIKGTQTDKVESYYKKALSYRDRAVDAIKKQETETSLDNSRKALECVIKALCLEEEIDIDSRDATLEKMIDNLYEREGINYDEKNASHKARIICNKGVHVSLNENIDPSDAKEAVGCVGVMLNKYTSRIYKK